MYYIGLDVHKKTISYCVKDASGRILRAIAASKKKNDRIDPESDPSPPSRGRWRSGMSPNDSLGRSLGSVDGSLKGATTSALTGLTATGATSSDVFVTKKGDMITATCVTTLTPIPGKPPG